MSELYPGADMAVVTAARLSATFPYVTPIARPPLPEECDAHAFHVADGGYYDNFGVVTAIEFLADVLPSFRQEFRCKKILLVQIRGSSAEEPEAATEKGWLYELLGPAITINKVRTSSQISRNDFEIGLFARYWAQRDSTSRVEIKSVTFDLRDPGPLSWHLSTSEKRDVEDSWTEPGIQAARDSVRAFLIGKSGESL